ncbi:MAG: molybdopterin-dependent oxidoreductase [Sneathiella sp.]|nr:molybdopterin-dependent oxidoreductase [Sneathiella sp.]
MPDTGLVKDVKVRAQNPAKYKANICIKGIHAPLGLSHEKRITHPLKRVGARGSGQWEQVSWDEALNDIALRLKKIVEEHGPEALAVSESPAIVQNSMGMTRRFMNLLGSPNYISGVALCMGNTAAVNRLTYGWFPFPDFQRAECIVLFGHDPKPHSWTPIYNAIRRAQLRGAKLIVIDPRESENAKVADLWLPLNPGTDAALCFGWLKVIIDEELYDKDFVANWTTGFEEFKERVNEFPLDRVAKITGVDADLIAQSARMYATSGPAVIPWTPITDQQRNSTSAIRLHGALRAICGFLDVPGGEIMHGFNPDVISETELEVHDELPQAKRDLQLGADKHPVFTYKMMASPEIRAATKRVWGNEWANIISGNYMAHPTSVFKAMKGDGPYPVKAFFTIANNTLMSYANMPLIHEALLNQDLIVAFEQFRSPTAQLADYILPSDSWLERNGLSDGFGWTSIVRPSQKVVNPAGECRGIYQVWSGLAKRMGFGEQFPWKNEEALMDHRLSKLGMNFEDFAETHAMHIPKMTLKKYEKTGFATPSGKVELKSSVLEKFGFDPLPYWREDPDLGPDFPLKMFVGVREDEYFQTGHRHIEKFRKRNTEPYFFVSVKDADEAGLTQGNWAEVFTVLGSVKAKVDIQEQMPEGVIRVPHGWWDPEREEGDGSLSGAWEFADSQICPDDDDHIDREQGIPQLKGTACRIQPLSADYSAKYAQK